MRMCMDRITETINTWIDHQEIAGCALTVRKADQLLYQQTFGYANMETRAPITMNSIYRMMSMTKVVTAVGVMKLIEDGKLSLDDPLSGYLPEFADSRVAADERYAYSPDMDKMRFLAMLKDFDLSSVKTVAAEREITIRDLLSHSSGLEQGIVGLLNMMKGPSINESLASETEKYSRYPLDFQPGTATSYSPLAGFDILLHLCEIISGKKADEYLWKTVFEPLGMKDSGFRPNEEQSTRLVRVYKRVDNVLTDVTGTNDDMDGMLHRGPAMISGSGGLYSTIVDYEHFARMLCNEGQLEGIRVLKPETVRLMHTEAAKKHLEPEPGMVWGLGVRVRLEPEKTGSSCSRGTYGWSGAFGTHFFISPSDQIEAVWCTNRSDAGGSGFSLSKKIENLVFECFQ